MSIASLILALLPAVAAKMRQPQPEKERKLEAEVKSLEFALDYWREAANAIQAQNERLIDERDALRRRVEERNQLAQPLAEAMRFSQQQMHHAQQAQAQLQHMQNAQLAVAQSQGLGQQNPYQQDQLGMQQGISQWHDCTCVPGRGSALRVNDVIPNQWDGA